MNFLQQAGTDARAQLRANRSDTMSDHTYPITNQDQADSAWKQRGQSKKHPEAEVVAHIRAMIAKHGLKMPGNAE